MMVCKREINKKINRKFLSLRILMILCAIFFIFSLSWAFLSILLPGSQFKITKEECHNSTPDMLDFYYLHTRYTYSCFIYNDSYCNESYKQLKNFYEKESETFCESAEVEEIIFSVKTDRLNNYSVWEMEKEGLTISWLDNNCEGIPESFYQINCNKRNKFLKTMCEGYFGEYQCGDYKVEVIE